MKNYIYEYDRILEHELANLKSSQLIECNKKLILDFYDYNFSMDISKPRLIRQINILKMAGLFLGKPFGEATALDFQRFIAHLKETNKSPETIYTYKATIKVFYKWLSGGNNYPECVAWFKNSGKTSRKLPESLLTQEDIAALERKALNPRDKALISLLWESGARIGEIGTLQLKNVAFDEFGCKILINGKTGMRRIRLVNSAPTLLQWINQHPNRNNPEAFVFINIEKGFEGQMRYRNIAASIEKIAKRAGITKPINPHHFRHSRATYMSQFLTEAQLKEYFGWVQESKAAARYVHLSGKQVDDAILRMHGLKEPDKKEDILKQKQCPRCKQLNDHNNEYCEKCWLPLTEKALTELDETKEKDQDSLVSLMKLLELVGSNPGKVRQALAILQQNVAETV